MMSRRHTAGGAVLFLHSRHTERFAGYLALTSLAAIVVGGNLVGLPALTGGSGVQAPAELLLPVLTGCIVAVGTASPADDLEAIGAVNLSPARLLHVCVLLGTAAVVFVAGAMLNPSFELARTVRNACGYIAFGLLGATAIGSMLGSLLPLAYLALVAQLGVDADGLPRSWAWPLQPASSVASWCWNVGLLAAGIAAYSLLGVRSRTSENPNFQ